MLHGLRAWFTFCGILSTVFNCLLPSYFSSCLHHLSILVLHLIHYIAMLRRVHVGYHFVAIQNGTVVTLNVNGDSCSSGTDGHNGKSITVPLAGDFRIKLVGTSPMSEYALDV